MSVDGIHIEWFARDILGDDLPPFHPDPLGLVKTEVDRLRAENEALKADAERFCALFSHIDKSGESPWSAIESVKYGERIDAGEPLIDVIREAIDKHLRGEGEK